MMLFRAKSKGKAIDLIMFSKVNQIRIPPFLLDDSLISFSFTSVTNTFLSAANS